VKRNPTNWNDKDISMVHANVNTEPVAKEKVRLFETRIVGLTLTHPIDQHFTIEPCRWGMHKSFVVGWSLICLSNGIRRWSLLLNLFGDDVDTFSILDNPPSAIEREV